MIIHVAQRDDAATGGAVQVACAFVKRLPSYGVDARLLFLYGKPGDFGVRLPGQCDYLGIKNSREVGKYDRLVRYLEQRKPAVVHFHDDLLWPQLLNFAARRWKTVIHAHTGGAARPRSWKVELLHWVQRWNADCVVCITENTKSSQIKNIGYIPDILRVVHNGVEQNQFRPVSADGRAEARRQFGLRNDAPIVGFVGRIYDEHKGIFDFLDVVRKLSPEYQGLIAGSGPDEAEVRNRAEKMGLGLRIRFAGLLAEPERAYQAIDVFAFTSRFEDFGLTIAEAMACGVPVVGFDCPGGWRELLTNETGQVILGRDVREMARAVERAARRDGNWPQKIAAAKDVLVSRHDWDVATRQLVAIYNELIEPRRILRNYFCILI